MRKSFKFRLYPTKSQVKSLENTLEVCRHVYNRTLEFRKDAWENEKKSISLYDTNKLLKVWSIEFPQNKTVYSQVLQNVQVRVDLAYQAFFRRVKAGEEPGYPRFKGKGRYDSFTYPQSGFKTLTDNRVYLSKIGKVKINFHRELIGKIKNLIITKSATDKWYVCFSCEVDSNPLPELKLSIGIDVGLTSFATLSNGEKVDNPRFFRKGEKIIAKAQHKLSKQDKDTPERIKARKVVAHVYEKVSNQRKDFAHKLSREWVNQFGIIVFEKLDIQSMLKNHYLAKSISDAAWNQLIQYTSYKAVDAGRKCILVNPRNTSKKCSRCGTLVEKDLSARIHSCPVCGLEIDRDLNAAINILALGLQCLDENPRNSRIYSGE